MKKKDTVTREIITAQLRKSRMKGSIKWDGK
jgi:hypothetical protein